MHAAADAGRLRRPAVATGVRARAPEADGPVRRQPLDRSWPPYSAVHHVPLATDQTVTASEGVSCKFGDLRVSDDRLYSSGYRGTAPGGPPNGRRRPGHAQTDLAAVYRLAPFGNRPLELRMDIVNAFDSTYVIHDGSGFRAVVLNSVVSIERSRRPPRGLGALAGAALLLGAPGVASAADEEIQVYMDEIGPVGRLGLDVHLNWTPDGRGADVTTLARPLRITWLEAVRSSPCRLR